MSRSKSVKEPNSPSPTLNLRGGMWGVIKNHFIGLVVFLFYLLTLPYFNELLTPCLRPQPAQSYSDAACNVAAALDHFILMALVGFGILTLTLFFLCKNLKLLTVTAIVLAGTIITAYLLYIPKVEQEIKRAPILLESLRH